MNWTTKDVHPHFDQTRDDPFDIAARMNPYIFPVGVDQIILPLFAGRDQVFPRFIGHEQILLGTPVASQLGKSVSILTLRKAVFCAFIAERPPL